MFAGRAIKSKLKGTSKSKGKLTTLVRSGTSKFVRRSAAADRVTEQVRRMTARNALGLGFQLGPLAPDSCFTRHVPPSLRLMTNWKAETLFQKGLLSGNEAGLKQHLFRSLASPVSSWFGTLFALTMLTTSLTSVWLFGMEQTLNADAIKAATDVDGVFHLSLYLQPDGPWHKVWYCFLGVFGAELVLRVAVYPSPWRDPMLWADVACCAELAIRVGLGPDKALEYYATGQRYSGVFMMLLAATMSLRFLKMTRYILGTRILVDTIKKSMTALIIPCYLFVLFACFFGTLVYAFEYDPIGGGAVPDLTTAWWMMLVTMTTVGYGDFSPVTTAGRVVTGITMIAGLVVMSMPLAIVGNNFVEVWESRTIKLIGERLRQRAMLIEPECVTAKEPAHIAFIAFHIFDQEGHGNFGYLDFKKVVLEQLNLRLSNRRLRGAWKDINADDNSHVDFTEFANALFPGLDDEDLISILKGAEELQHSSSTTGTAPQYAADGSSEKRLSKDRPSLLGKATEGVVRSLSSKNLDKIAPAPEDKQRQQQQGLQSSPSHLRIASDEGHSPVATRDTDDSFAIGSDATGAEVSRQLVVTAGRLSDLEGSVKQANESHGARLAQLEAAMQRLEASMGSVLHALEQRP